MNNELEDLNRQMSDACGKQQGYIESRPTRSIQFSVYYYAKKKGKTPENDSEMFLMCQELRRRHKKIPTVKSKMVHSFN